MKKNIYRITVKSSDNPDWNGQWKMADIREEMEELMDMKNVDAQDAVDYIFEHLFESDDYVLIDSIVVSNLEYITKIKLALPNGHVYIEFE